MSGVPNIFSKIFSKKLHRASVNGVPNIFSKIFSKKLHRASVNNVPNISLKISPQKASPTTCDSLFELIPNISWNILQGLHPTSMSALQAHSNIRFAHDTKYYPNILR